MDLLATRSVQVHASIVLLSHAVTQSNGGKSLSHLMKISIESPEKLSDSDLENIVDVWNRRIVV